MPLDISDQGANEKDKNELVLSFIAVRRFVGIIGVLLPFLLILYSLMIDGSGPKRTISSYFYSGGREILVGSLFGLGVFLYAYKGFSKDTRQPSDKLISRAAAICAIGIAFFPMSFANSDATVKPVPTWMQSIFGEGLCYALHGASALIFFACLATFCLVNFQRHKPGSEPDPEKKVRNGIFTFLGCVIILATIGFLLGSFLQFDSAFVFWMESIAVWAFGISWLIKGEAMEKALGPIYRLRGAR